jgi:hypothetical protein
MRCQPSIDRAFADIGYLLRAPEAPHLREGDRAAQCPTRSHPAPDGGRRGGGRRGHVGMPIDRLRCGSACPSRTAMPSGAVKIGQPSDEEGDIHHAHDLLDHDQCARHPGDRRDLAEAG